MALALGPELLGKVAFVGGCTTGLHLTDDLAKEGVRHTMDVDLIVPVIGAVEWISLQHELRKRGFIDDIVGESPVCAMKLGELRVDFMPDDADVLGFGNRWYREALSTAISVQLMATHIRLVSPVYFLATKFEAYKGRGDGDLLASQDVEDVLTIFNGRREIVDEVLAASPELLDYLRREVATLLGHPDIDYAVQSASGGDPGVAGVIYERLESVLGAG